jgi:steroid delta-isomerase-like uncharacterized protein
MGTEQNKAAIRAAAELWNGGDVDAYLAHYTDDAVWHGMPPEVPPTNAGAKAFFERLRAGLPDARVEIEDTVAEGDRVVLRFTVHGTHEGELMGAQPSGNAIAVGAMSVLRFEDGKVAERWTQLDTLSLLAQLGLVPQPAAA